MTGEKTTEQSMGSAMRPMVPPPLQIFQMATGHYISRAIFLAAKWGIADLMKDGPCRYEEIAKATNTHGPSLNRMMRLLASAGVFEEQDNGNFKLTPIGEFMRSGVPRSMRASVMLFAGVGIQDSWKELEYCVQTGEPAFRKKSPDADAFTFINEDPAAAKAFDDAMATFAPMTAAAVSTAYDFSTFGTVADIGGGNGAILVALLDLNPNLRGIVFDRPQAADSAKGRIAEAGMESRCEAIGGDFFKDVPPGADAYVLKHVIHDWNDEKAIAILKNCHRAMGAEGRLLIVEGVYPTRIDQSDISRGAASNDVNMLVCTGGRQRSEAEFKALYLAAGFRLTRIVPTMARVSVIEGVRA